VAGALAVSLAGLLATGRASAQTKRTAGPAASASPPRGGPGRQRRPRRRATARRRAAIGPIVLPACGQLLPARLGVDSLAVRWGESGEVIRFSYRVLDAEKAKVLNDKKNEPSLVDPRAGVKLVVRPLRT